MQKQGFTLIELIIVIVILGILSVVAAPRFIDLSTDAKVSTLSGMKAAMESGKDLIYAKAILEDSTEGATTLNIDGTNISLHSGYPVGNWMAGFRYITRLDDVVYSTPTAICELDWCGRGNQTSIPSGVSVTSPGRIGKVWPRGYSWNDQCGVYYLNREDGSEAEVGVVDSGC